MCCALALVAPLALGCPPAPRGELRIPPTTAALAGNEVHFVVRANATALAHAESMQLFVNVPAEGVEALALVPDEPELTGVSVGSEPLWVNLSANLPLAAILRERCADDGICEVGITAVVTPIEGSEIPPSAVDLGASAFTDVEETFPVSATLELEIDGEAPVAATRSDR
jgi:hypothetical protein